VARYPVLDSDVLIDHLRGSGPAFMLVTRLADSLDFVVTAISAFELSLGTSLTTDPEPVLALLEAPALPLTHAAALRSGDLARRLREGGKTIGVRDAMQAGICLEAELPLVTRNASHFERVPDLEVVAPAEWLARLDSG